MNNICRCGWDGTGHHPCHNNNYTCGKPSLIRFYKLKSDINFSLAGFQEKYTINDTFACDDCWNSYTEDKEEFIFISK